MEALRNWFIGDRLFSVLIAILVFILTFFLARTLLGQRSDADPSRPDLHQAGEIFVVTISPTTSQIDVFAAGLPLAKMDPSKIEVLGHQIDLSNHRREFALRWRNGSYQIAEPIDSTLKIELEVFDKRTDRSENFEFPPLRPY